ncbi:uncharacterized protein LOC132722847 [Ruditapes philippinarum]|uniref:uncharacterized protein LOC132722847 n=1 Tax=Ruditapes philippinarum TaxID=129788 RepID=UPI00295B5F53|nr:uncharacterized protein LOC132722847 [Ruditapes philippinarum]
MNFFLFYLLTSITVSTDITGCKDVLMTENKDCFDGYKTYLANLGNSGADSSQILSLLCRDEGRAATNCLKPLLDECKELADDDMYLVFTVLDTMGGCEVLESPETIVDVNGEMSNDGTEIVDEVDHDIANYTTLFAKLQEESKAICSNWTEKLQCSDNTCPKVERQENKSKQRRSNQTGLSFDVQLLKFQCPLFSPDYYEDGCLEDRLTTDLQYITCFNNATNFMKTNLTCEQYKSAYDCVKTAIKPCKDGHKEAFLNTTNIYIDVMFERDCKIEIGKAITKENTVEKATSNAYVNMLSFNTMFISIAIVLTFLY